MLFKTHVQNKYPESSLITQEIHNLQQCTNFNAPVIALKLDPSSSTKTIIFFLKPYLSNNFVKLLAKACPIVFVASNKPIVTCWVANHYLEN